MSAARRSKARDPQLRRLAVHEQGPLAEAELVTTEPVRRRQGNPPHALVSAARPARAKSSAESRAMGQAEALMLARWILELK